MLSYLYNAFPLLISINCMMGKIHFFPKGIVWGL